MAAQQIRRVLTAVLAVAALAGAHAAPAAAAHDRVRVLGSSTVEAGERLTLAVTAHGPRRGRVTFRLLLSRDRRPSADDVTLGAVRRRRARPSGTTRARAAVVVPDLGRRGRRHVLACVGVPGRASARRRGQRSRRGHRSRRGTAARCASTGRLTIRPARFAPAPRTEPPPAPAPEPPQPPAASAAAPVPAVAPEPPAPPAEAAPAPTGRSIPLGAAVWFGCTEQTYTGPSPLACKLPYDARYDATARTFDHFVAENELKELWVHPARGVWDFEVADRLVRWAGAQGKHVRGHTLIYGDATPWWKHRPAEPWTREALLAEMRDHILTTMRHFKRTAPGVVREWDVVNEAFEDDGSYDQNVYLQVIGPEYVEHAFRFAREADPDAVLVLNEYDADRPSSARARAMHAAVEDLVARGVPIDGVGLQMHLGTGGNHPTADELAEHAARYAALGLTVQFTELDVGTTPTPAGLDPVAEQRAVYELAARACAEAPNCTGVTLWGVADHHSWRGAHERALLVDDAFTPKQALGDVRALLSPAGAARTASR